ncbi:rod shape-determining protein MreC [Evtepia sp.]|uniref:rod shape-determining protein MreC n=1 Tax=Evtepia sp. TaxID=2773933 RepID=UPI002A75B42F|nr:rod shape-determining protein MreC [Evtepia sp.]
MKEWFRHKWMKIAAAALSLSLTAAALTVVLNGTAGPLGRWGETVSRPFLRLFSSVTGAVRQGEDYLRGISQLRQEKQALEQELAQARQGALEGALALEENDRLRSLLGFQQRRRDLTLTPAWVVARTPDNWQGEVTLDQGENQGLRPGQCVVDQRGALVGLIKEAGPSWSKVTLLCDGGFRLTGQGIRSGELGELTGDLTLLARQEGKLSGLPLDTQVQLGEEVVTYSVSGSGPSGLSVGKVSALEEDPGGLSMSAILTPSADLSRLTQVFVVTAFQEVR